MTLPRSALSLAAAAAILASSGFAAPRQGTFAVHRPEHVRLLHAEREALLGEAWLRAGAARRERAVAWFHARRRPGAPARARPAFETLADVAALLAGQDPGRADRPWTERLAPSLDLRVVPGVFAAREEGRGESMVVHIEALYPVEAPENARELPLTLTWLGPAGEEVEARTEPVPTACFDREGFEMFVRPPASEPGRWRLVADVGRAGERRRGSPIAVDCVRDLAERRARLQQETARAPSALRAELWAALGPLSEHGLRRLGSLDLGHWFDFCERLPLADLAAPIVPWTGREAAAEGAGGAFWTLPHEQRFERGLLIACDSAEHPASVLAGAAGEGWRRLSTRRSVRVFVGACSSAPGGAARLLEEAVALAAERDWAGLVVLARGDRGTAFLRELQRSCPEPVEGLVLCAALGAAPSGGAELPVPLLFLDALAAEDGVASGEGWRRVVSREPGFLLDPRVPGLVEAWLAEGR
ncbi:MAG: hypothetical protein QF903_14655 [Planctomycetota bacterium]|jgi:hypothetical protein|nr:hypothetical protein [Planctomycetota bacterium]MDP6762048.1 hypothetical protein [Planctomycetota bacterium]MDP6990709.1 hypothetical protein [Planctomycetota bacterium]